MEISPMNVDHACQIHSQIDRLSDLPDALLVSILTLLPTRMAARTSLLCCRFRHLWEALPSLDLIGLTDQSFPNMSRKQVEDFTKMADRALLRHDPSLPLLSFRLEIPFCDRYCHKIIFPLLVKACSFSLRQLTIDTHRFTHIAPILPAIFSITSLESLSLLSIAPIHGFCQKDYALPSAASLTRLTSLSIGSYAVRPTHFNHMLSQLPSLQELQLGVCNGSPNVAIVSHTIRKLKVKVQPCKPEFGMLRLSFPLLESLHVEYRETFLELSPIHRQFPRQSKAVLDLNSIHDGNFTSVSDLLSYVSHAEEIILDVKQVHIIWSSYQREFLLRFEKTERWCLLHSIKEWWKDTYDGALPI